VLLQPAARRHLPWSSDFTYRFGRINSSTDAKTRPVLVYIVQIINKNRVMWPYRVPSIRSLPRCCARDPAPTGMSAGNTDDIALPEFNACVPMGLLDRHRGQVGAAFGHAAKTPT
jgi:hypothetical protein